MRISRRDLLRGAAGGVALHALGCNLAPTSGASPDLGGQGPNPDALPPGWHNRGIVVLTSDLLIQDAAHQTFDWPGHAKDAGITTVALHTQTPNEDMIPFIQSAPGQAFLDRCAALGLEVEYEMHAMDELVPRDLFDSQPELFRTDAECNRNPDHNFCIHTPMALEIAAENAIAMCKILRSTTDRYFLWPADSAPWCQCVCCDPLQLSDQALTAENYILTALRSEFPKATLSHLAYTVTLDAPATVKPIPGVFLEFAPFYRRFDIPFNTPSDPTQATHLAALDANLAVFGAADAQALEYWLDDSKWSGYQPNRLQPVPWNDAIFVSDVQTYHQRGVYNVTSFGAYLNALYVQMYGDPPIAEYGAGLNQP